MAAPLTLLAQTSPRGLASRPGQKESATNPDIDEALRKLAGRRFDYEMFRNYYDGRHRLAFASEKFLNTFGRLFQMFADNLCPPVVDAVADRLTIKGFGSKKGGQGAAKLAQQIWEDNHMDRRAGEVHQDCLKLGDSYVIVWPNYRTGEPSIWPQKGDLITVKYDEDEYDEIEWGAKFWVYQGYVRLNMYYPNLIEKYITKSKSTQLPQKASAFTPFIDDTKGETSPVVMNPYGRVPIFHFINNGPCGAFGRSELHDVVPLQDALNKAVIDMLVTMEFQSFPQRYAVGIEVELDSDNRPIIPWQPGVDRLWSVPAPDAKFGQFEAANLQQFLSVQGDMRLEIARVSSTPMHYMHLTANPPSGEALQAMEERFVKKCIDRVVAFGDTWEDVVEFAIDMKTRREVELNTQWADPAPKSALQQSQVALNKKMIGVSNRQLMREMDYSDEQVDQFQQERKAEADFNQSILPTAPNSVQSAQEGQPAPDATNNPANTQQENQRLNTGRQASAQ